MPNQSIDTKQSIDTAQSTADRTADQPWRKATGGGWIFIVLCIVALIGLTLAAGRNWQADSVGEDDGGVVHPQSVGVDDDVAQTYDE